MIDITMADKSNKQLVGTSLLWEFGGLKSRVITLPGETLIGMAILKRYKFQFDVNASPPFTTQVQDGKIDHT